MGMRRAGEQGRLALRLWGAASLLALTSATTAFAQAQGPSPSPADGSASQLQEIVVTGSLIRGVAPVGTNVSSVGQADIQRQGALSTNQILAQIPTVTNTFNVVPVTPASLGRSTYRPDLRNLGATGGASTLILVDGHNLVGAGILQTTPDAGVIPPGALERVEVVADGGSSIYGSDAIGGTINFITRTRFQGFEVSGHGGFADGYRAGDLNLTGGTAWNRGSAVVSVMMRESSELSNADRKFPRQDLRPYGGSDFRVRTCPIGTIIANGTTYALPGKVPGTVNLCDTALNGVITPKERQYAGFAAITQELGDGLEFKVKGLASERTTKLRQTQISDGGAVINNTNPFFQSVAGETQQTVALDFSSVLGPYTYATSVLSTLDVTPTLTWKLANGWRTEALFDYGWSDTNVHVPGINSAAEAAALRGAGLTTQTALNPYDLTQSNTLLVYNVANFENYARARQTLWTARLNADGALMALPGGDLRLAVGGQLQRQHINALSVNAPRGVEFGAVRANASRDVRSVYGELLVPVIGSGNAMPFVKALNLDLSLRYDSFSDAGNTTNPKIGATWDMGSGFRVRGNWGTAFQAPSLADSTGAVDTRTNIVATTNNIKPGDPASDRARPTIQLAGGNPNLKPQTAHTWSIGADFSPEALSGLDLSATFWSVKIDKAIGIAPTGTPDVYTIPAYAPYFIYRPTLAQALAATQGQIVTGATSVASLYGIGNDPYILTYSTRQNLGTLWVNGIDARLSYRHATGFGDVYASLNGTWQTRRKSQPIAGAPIVDQLLSGRPKSQLQGVLGTDIGKLTASATMNYTSGFDVVGVSGQTHVGSFHPVNLFFRYAIDTNFDVTLNIDNAFNIQPPMVNLSGGTPNNAGFQINSTLGRFFNIGLRKRF